MKQTPLPPVTLADQAAAARQRLDAATWAWLQGGAGDELTLRANQAAWQQIGLWPRVLRPLAGGHTRIRLAGREWPHPIGLAPVALQRLAHPDGEWASALAAAAQGAGFILGTQSSVPLERVAQAVLGDAGRGPLWFQLYWQADRGFNRALAQRAEAAGFEAIVLTVDAPVQGVRDGDAAAALACVGPQGIDGCGYESPLEAMSQALNPGACWNDPAGCDDPQWAWIDEPFLRDGAVLAIAIITDETDCSVRDYGIMNDPDFEEVNPVTEIASPSSALCWHAGAACNDFDPATGEYGECVQTNRDDTGLAGVPDEAAVLQPISRYTKLLQSLRDQGREVIMLGVLGVPEVTAHASTPPYNPTAGGVEDLVYRLWRDPQYPDGDVLPDEWARGVDAAYKQFEFGIGPGCTGFDEAAGVFTGQAVADVRIRSVCESLNTPEDPSTPASEARVRCCIESICDDDFSAAIGCLTGLIQTAVTPVG
jgi:hypothetical protein